MIVSRISFPAVQMRLAACLLAGFRLSASGVENPDFYQDVFPFLKANCISCHNKTTTKAGLNMETPELMKKGGDSGPGVVPGKSAESLIVEASVHTVDMEMPPPNNKSGAVKLTDAEIAVLKTWIDQGAKASVLQERQVTWKPLAPGVDPIYSIALTRDGRYAACGRSNRIYLYDLATRQFVAEITDPAEKAGGAHRAMVNSLAFSPDGTRLASGSFREVKVWKMEPGKAGEGAATPTPATTPATPADEALLKKIAETGKVAVANHALSADRKQIVTGCADGSVRVWDVASVKQIADLRGSPAITKEGAALEWTIARETLEQAFQKSEVARIEAQNKALDELLKKANAAIVEMKKVLPEKEKLVKPAQDEKAVAQKAVDEVLALIAAAPEGKADAALEKKLKDAQEKLGPVSIKETSALAGVSATQNNIVDAEADGRRIAESKTKNTQLLAAATSASAAAKTTQDKAAADLAALKASVAKRMGKPTAVALSPDGLRAAGVFEGGKLVVWAVATGVPIEELAAPVAPVAPAVAPVAAPAAAPAAAPVVAPAAPAASAVAAPAALTGRLDGLFTVTASGGKTIVSSPAPKWALERLIGGTQDHPLFVDRVNAVRFSPDGKLLATGGGEPSRTGDLTIFDLATGKATATWKDRYDDIVMCLDFSPDGKLLASGAADKIARVIETATGKQVNLFEGHTHYVMGVAFRADGRVLATGGADGVVTSWDMILGERKKKIEGWTKEVTSLQFIGATNQIVTSAGDNRVRIVNDDGVEVRSITGLPDFMQAAASTPNGATLVGGGEDSNLRVWNGADGKEVAVFGMK